MFATLLGSKLRARILGWIFTHPDERYFGRQLESLLGEDSTNISRELARLAVMGVLTCQAEGRQKYYQANAACPVFGELRGLAAKTFGLAEALQEFLRPLRRKVAVAFVYGSQAGGKAHAASDVDLMVIGKATFGEVVAALHPAHDRLGREVNPTVYPEAEFRAKLTKKHPFLRAVMDGPKIFLVGDECVLKGLAEKRLARRPPGQPAGNHRPPDRGRARHGRLPRGGAEPRLAIEHRLQRRPPTGDGRSCGGGLPGGPRRAPLPGYPIAGAYPQGRPKPHRPVRPVPQEEKHRRV